MMNRHLEALLPQTEPNMIDQMRKLFTRVKKKNEIRGMNIIYEKRRKLEKTLEES